MKKIIQLSLLFFISSNIFGQVQFKIDWLESSERYLVSLVSDETWQTPQNITSTAQITLKVPTGDFEVTNLINLQPETVFELNSRHNSPEEAPEFDYISFGLQTIGTNGLKYTAGQELKLFSFQNSGDCSGIVYLVDKEDVFLPPNSKMANIANQITILGAQGDAYIGNVGEGKVDCNFSTGIFDQDQLKTTFNIFPNPVEDNLNIHFEWTQPNEDMVLAVYDVHGKQVQRYETTFVNGKNTLVFEVENLRAGAYTIEVHGKDLKGVIDRFVKL